MDEIEHTGVTTIDTEYTGRPEFAAAYLLDGGKEVAFVETNTTAAVPRLLSTLAASGHSPEAVTYVIITHIHLDHAGGAGALMAACPNATLLAHPKAAPHAIDPAKIVAGATDVYGAELFAELYGEVIPTPAERVRALEDGQSVTLGDRTLSFLHTRGHANHHFCIHDDVARGVFTGDSFGLLYPSLQRNGTVALPSTTPTDFDSEAAHASIDRIVALGAKRVYPTHYGEHHTIVEAAAALHRQLDEYAAIVREADTSGRDGGELDGFCLEGVRKLMHAELENAGMGSDADALALVAGDTQLNAQGLAFAVRKLRYKRSKTAST